MTKYRKKFLVTMLVAVICVPIVLNFLCLTVFPAPIIGNGKLWLTFWGSFIGGMLPVLAAIYVLDEEHRKNRYRKDYEIQKEYFNSLCVDMGKLCSSIDIDILCFYLSRLSRIEDINVTILEIGKLENTINSVYNEFCLKHAHYRGEEGEKLISLFASYSTVISNQVSIIQEVIIDRQKGVATDNVYNFTIAKACKELEKLGDIQTNLFLLANDWKKREWNVTEKLRDNYVNG